VTTSQDNPRKSRGLWIGAILFALALAFAFQQALTEQNHPVFAWQGVAAASLGLVLFVMATRLSVAPWLIGAAALPTVYLVFYLGMMAITRDVLPLVRLGVGVAVAAAYLMAVRSLSDRVQYASCAAALGGMALFFQVWEPPAPNPLPLARSLVANFPRTLGTWTGEHVPLDAITEKALGADEYLNLQLAAPDGRHATVFVAYNANAWSNVPHVPWVCMVQSGFTLVKERVDEVLIPSISDKEIPVKVMLFEQQTEDGRTDRALVFHYFNVGRQYTTNRQIARVLATTGSLSQRGSYLSQTQVAVSPGLNDTSDPLAKDSETYKVGVALLNQVVPQLEKEYYPDLSGAKGG